MSLTDQDEQARGSEVERGRALAQKLEHALAAPDPAPVPPAIPDHQLLHRIGRGAYGEVWVARNALGTLRAVKIVYRSRFEEDRPYEREFQGILKYEPVSRSHEGLVHVLHVGRNDVAGYFYYVMELADDAGEGLGPAASELEDARRPASGDAPRLPGPRPADESPRMAERYAPRTLRAELSVRRRLRPAEAAQLVLRLADALGHLHAHGLVHRDIKPSNVIFVGGHPKLADIGLVTNVGSSQSIVGTEGFIPPEGPGTPQADLYGLGKLLYELATGQDRMEFPHLPAAARLPEGEALWELNEIMTRACAPSPAQRYASTLELQAELSLFLAGRSLRRMRSTERHLARLKRLATAATLLLAAATVVLGLVRREERRAQVQARSEAALRHRAETAEQAARQQLYTALLEQARATVRSGERGQRTRALEALRRAAAITNTAELRREALTALALPDLRLEGELALGSEFTLRLLSPSFRQIAVCRGRGPVEIRSVPDLRVLATLPASAERPAHHAEWSADESFLAVKRDRTAAGAQADWEVWHLVEPRLALRLPSLSVNAVAFHPRLPRILAGHPSSQVELWNLEDGGKRALPSLPGEPIGLEFAPDGERFASVCQVGASWVVTLHDAVTGTRLASHPFTEFVTTARWHPGGRWLAVPDHGGLIHEMDAQTGATRVLGRHKAQAVEAVFSPDGAHLLTGGWERELICWDVAGTRRAFAIDLDSYTVRFRTDGRSCAVITRSGVQFHTFEQTIGHRALSEDLGARLRHAAFSSDGRWLAAAGDKRLGLWDLAQGGPAALDDHAHGAHPFFTPDGRELFGSRSTGGDHEGFRWRLTPSTKAGAAPGLFALPFEKPAGFTFLGLAGDSLVLTGAKGSQWLAPGELTAAGDRWRRTHAGISRVAPDGRWLTIYRPFSTTLHVYRLPEVEPVATLAHPANIADVEFAPSGDALAICSSQRVEIWNTTTWQATRQLTNFIRLLYAPDGRGLWLTKDLRTAGLYDAPTLQLQLPLPAGTLPLALSRDGRRLAVSVDTRRLEVWDLVELGRELRELGLAWPEPGESQPP